MTGYRIKGRTWHRCAVLLLVAFAALWLAVSARMAWSLPSQGPGGPVLVITTPESGFGDFYAEILRTEGLNAFAVADASAINATTLAAYDVVILAKQSLNPTQVATLTTWVNGGGNLIAMRPDAQLATLLGLSPTGTTLTDAYLLVDTSSAAGNGIVGQTMQFHGTADRYASAGAASIATLYSSANTSTSNPAVTLRTVGNGRAAAFAYDLATSIVLTRQGNPAWAAQERDGYAPIRSDDKFFGAATGDVRPDWIDLTKVAIPQADEQQRLLANLILTMNQGKKPLPRFWYFPKGKKAVIVMTGDDHGNGGTSGRFDQFKASSPAGCSVADWECIRGTSYIYANTPVSNTAAAQYQAEGFEISLHLNTGCANFDATSLEADYNSQLSDFAAKYTSVSAPSTQRHHCIVWSDWTTAATTQLSHGMRLDTSYYYWPPSWLNNTPGLFTGSAMPMRFSGLDGQLIDVYGAATQMTDESGQSYPFTPATLLDRALGTEGYFGAYVINAHTDVAIEDEATTTVAAAQQRGVPVVSARQMLTWLDARNASTFGSFAWDGASLSFAISRDPNANNLQAMLPARSTAGGLATLTRAGAPVAFSVQTIKGIDYAFFNADGGSYVATYASDTTPPAVSSVSPGNGAQSVSFSTDVSVVFSESMLAASVNSSTVQLSAGGSSVPASVSYDAATRTALLHPTSLLASGTTYTVTVLGAAADPRVKDLAGNPLTVPYTSTFTTAAGLGCPCSTWGSSVTPTNSAANDPNAVELGVKFTTSVNGTITGVRFYKGTTNTGTHVGHLWSASGQLLATANFVGESASGWQEATFSTPVAVTAGTVYTASYFAPNGNYAYDYDYFAAGSVTNGPVTLLADGLAGGNGVYQYGASSFPASSWRSSNYWVDVVFTTGGSAPDTTPPSVASTVPASGATGVNVGSPVSVTFSEPMTASTIGTSTIELRDSANTLVTASVSYDSASRTATLTPGAALAANTVYTATVRGGATDPRVKDVSGNALAANTVWSFTTAAPSGACANPANAIVAENCLSGNPSSEWDIAAGTVGDPSIQGYATEISVNRGSTISFKVDTSSTNYRFDIYRMGYYGGMGARKVATVLPSASLPQNQPNCLTESTSGLIDCGNWSVSGSWAVPATAATGIYFAKLVRADTGGASHIVFVVRNDASTSDLVFQTSDTTWQAYNNYGGNSLYEGGPGTSPGRAYKVSYNRPFATRAVDNGQDWVFNAEYPMVRFLEANGYDVSYISGVDTERAGSLLLNHRAWLSVGHDEYWSAGQRASVEAARNAGVHLAFFSGNEAFWKTRWQASIDGSNSAYRTLVCYKETHAGAKIDPTSTWTGTWRDPRFSPPSDGNRPENNLSGTIFMVNNSGASNTTMSVPEADGKMRLWRGTNIATQASGGSATLPSGVLGYEWDVDADNGSRPAGLIRMSTTIKSDQSVLQDYGSTYGSGVVNHALTLYRHPTSRALVFGAGTVQWAWGLDANHDRGGTPVDTRMQQATINLMADMNAQPATLLGGLALASASADASAPTSSIASPAAGAVLTPNSVVTISGTAVDAGGGNVGGVEVSVDNGATWRAAAGRANWSYSWTTPATNGTATLLTRAVDDSGNIETPGAGRSVTVGTPADTTPPTVTATSPASGATGVSGTVDVTATFSEAMTASTISGSTVLLRDAANAQVAAAVSYNATTRVVTLNPTPTLTAGATYTATITGGASGVKDAAGNALAANFSWSFTVFIDNVPPTVAPTSPTAGATGVSTTANLTATFNEAMTASTITTTTVQLRDPANALIASAVSYNATSRVVTINPTPTLANNTVYTVTIVGGASGVKDSAGNGMTSSASWTFTTVPDTTAPTVSSTSPASNATGVSRTGNITVTFSEAMDPATINGNTIQLRDSSNNLVAAVVTWDAANLRATLNPTPTLGSFAVYTMTVRGGTTDPRVKDVAGNALAANRTWSFRTSIL